MRADAFEEIGSISGLSGDGGKGVVPAGIVALSTVVLAGERVGACEITQGRLVFVLEELGDSEIEKRRLGAGILIGQNSKALRGKGIVALGVGREGGGELLGRWLGVGSFSAEDERWGEVEGRRQLGDTRLRFRRLSAAGGRRSLGGL